MTGRRDAIVDPARVGASVRAQGGGDRDVAEALALDAYLRRVDVTQPGGGLPAQLLEWAKGSRAAEAIDWRDVHGWEGDDG